jgi:putative ABC transport system substrate-binding protein
MQFDRLKRREFITLLGAAAAWPLAARAQQTIRRVGMLQPAAADDAEFRTRARAFLEGLQQLGWTIGQNLQIESRWATTTDELRRHAAELAALAPDAILSASSPALAALQQATRSVPIVFVTVIDPVGSGYVESLARPGGNTTGFMLYEYSLAGKWLELLKQIAPKVSRAAVFRDTGNPSGNAQFGAIQAVAPPLGIEVSPINVRDAGEIERAVAVFARSANGGLIVTGSASATAHRNLIIELADRAKLPVVYYARYFVDAGGLISYGPDFIDEFRRAAGYVDRILKGEKPANLPVQAPTKYELVVNLKTARALGLELPASVLARADGVIE